MQRGEFAQIADRMRFAYARMEITMRDAQGQHNGKVPSLANDCRCHCAGTMQGYSSEILTATSILSFDRNLPSFKRVLQLH